MTDIEPKTIAADIAWESWKIDEKNLSAYTAAQRHSFFRHAIVLGLEDKALMLFRTLDAADIDPGQILVDIAKQGHIHVFDALVAAGLSFHETQLNNAFTVAVDFVRADFAVHLLKAGADVHFRDDIAYISALGQPQGKTDMLAALLAYEQLPQEKLCDYAHTVLAAKRIDMFATIVEAGGLDVSAHAEKLLCAAVTTKPTYVESIRALVDHGADIHINDEAPFRAALADRNALSVQYLVRRLGVDPMMLPADIMPSDYSSNVVYDVILKGLKFHAQSAAESLAEAPLPNVLLARTQTFYGFSPLAACVRAGLLCKAVSAVVKLPLAERAQYMTADDFLANISPTQTVLDIVIRTGQVAELFTPALWGGRTAEAMRLWEHIDGETRTKITDAPFLELQRYEAAAAVTERLEKQQTQKPRRPPSGLGF